MDVTIFSLNFMKPEWESMLFIKFYENPNGRQRFEKANHDFKEHKSHEMII